MKIGLLASLASCFPPPVEKQAFLWEADNLKRVQIREQLTIEKMARPPVQPATFEPGKPDGEGLVIQNPSFEGQTGAGIGAKDWIDCSFFDESPSDVQPGFYDVERKAQHGKTYVGMVVRRYGTWEAIAQCLSKPLEASKTYDWSMQLCRSETYSSPNRMKSPAINSQGVRFFYEDFLQPVCLRIWAGSKSCEKVELLAESQPIENHEWQQSTFRLKPAKTHEFILLEAFYNWGDEKECYNGHLLIDNLSNIQPVKIDSI